MIVLDASVLIAYLDADDAQHATAEALLVREVDDQLATNPLTLAEVLMAPTRDGRLEPVLAACGSSRSSRCPSRTTLRFAWRNYVWTLG